MLHTDSLRNFVYLFLRYKYLSAHRRLTNHEYTTRPDFLAQTAYFIDIYDISIK